MIVIGRREGLKKRRLGRVEEGRNRSGGREGLERRRGGRKTTLNSVND